MAASRMGIWSFGNKRFKLFAYLAIFTIIMQIFLAYNFYTMNQTELNKIKQMEANTVKGQAKSLQKHKNTELAEENSENTVPSKSLQDAIKVPYHDIYFLYFVYLFILL